MKSPAAPIRGRMPAGRSAPGDGRGRSAGGRLESRRAQAVRVALVGLLVAVFVGHQASGNYIYAIWYILFGLGQGVASWQRRAIAAVRPAALRGRVQIGQSPVVGPRQG